MRRLIRLVGEAHAKELVLLGHTLSVDEALRIGLVNFVAERSSLDEKLSGTLEHLLSLRADLFAFAKSRLRTSDDLNSDSSTSYDVLATAYAKLTAKKE